MFKPNPYRWITPRNISESQRRAWGIGLLLMLVIFALLAANQGNAQELCTPDLTVVQAEYDKVSAADDVLVALRDFRAWAAGYDADCRGLAFDSDTDGLQPALGPISFANGVYRATFTTEGYGSVQFTPLSGDCDDMNTLFLFNETAGDASTGAQAVFTAMDSCSALIQLSNITEAWTLTFELIAPAQ